MFQHINKIENKEEEKKQTKINKLLVTILPLLLDFNFVVVYTSLSLNVYQKYVYDDNKLTP